MKSEPTAPFVSTELDTASRVQLAPIVPEIDAPKVYELVNEDLDHMHSFDFGSANFSTVASTQSYLEELCEGGSAFSITLSGQIAGNLYVSNHEAPELATLAYWVAKKYTRRGIGTEAVRQAIDFTFTHLGKDGLLAAAALDNEPSIALLKKTGFVQIQRLNLELEEGLTTVGVFGLVRPDWPGLEELMAEDA